MSQKNVSSYSISHCYMSDFSELNFTSCLGISRRMSDPGLELAPWIMLAWVRLGCPRRSHCWEILSGHTVVYLAVDHLIFLRVVPIGLHGLRCFREESVNSRSPSSSRLIPAVGPSPSVMRTIIRTYKSFIYVTIVL